MEVASKFLVMKWEWIEEALSNEELNNLYGLLDKASSNKPDYNYYVVNSDEPYADKVLQMIKKGDSKISREKVLETLTELSNLKDNELAQEEVIEVLMKYINDSELEKAYERSS